MTFNLTNVVVFKKMKTTESYYYTIISFEIYCNQFIVFDKQRGEKRRKKKLSTKTKEID